MNNFTVEVVTSDNRTTQSCGEYRKADPVRRGGSYTFNCNSKQGRYVYVRRLQGSREQWLITLCEVVIDDFITTTSATTTTSTTTNESIIQNTTPVSSSSSSSSKDNGNSLHVSS